MKRINDVPLKVFYFSVVICISMSLGVQQLFLLVQTGFNFGVTVLYTRQ
jgi:hypothetical protein